MTNRPERPARNATLYLLHPNAKWEGCLTAVCAGDDCAERVAALERAPQRRAFRVRAVLGDAPPLHGEPTDLVGVRPYFRIRLNEDPLTFHVHRGGRDVLFFTFVSDGSAERLLSYVEVLVDTSYPRSALRLGRTAISMLLDTLAINWDLPLAIVRLDLIDPDGNDPAISELILPYAGAIAMGPLGGFDQSRLFAPWHAVLREAMTATSPFWKLMCAFRAYDGVRHLRKQMKDDAERMGVTEKLPKDPEIDVDALRTAGVAPEFLSDVRRASDLFAKLTKMRDGVAHFLLDGGEHVHFSDGRLYSEYSTAATILLNAATTTIKELRGYYGRNIEDARRIGSIMPDKSDAAKYPVRDPGDAPRPMS